MFPISITIFSCIISPVFVFASFAESPSFSPLSLYYTLSYETSNLKPFKFKISIIRRYSWRTKVHNISGEKVFISALYIKIHLIKLRYSIFPYISSYFKHFTWPLVFVSCLRQTARAREPKTYVLPKLVINVKDWSAKDNKGNT